MKRIAIALGFVLAAAPAFAQKVDGDPERTDTLRILVTGRVNFDLVFRDAELTDTRLGSGEDEFTIEGDLKLRLDLEMQENIAATVTIRNKRLAEGATLAIGSNPEATGVIFDEANITVNDFLTASLKMTLGILQPTFDIRGRGSAFFFDPAHSDPLTAKLGASGTVFAAGLEDELQPAGVALTYNRENVTFGAWILPAVIEGGRATDDEAAYALWFLWAFEKGTRFGAIFNVSSVPGHDTSLYTLGGGITLHGLVDGLELYGEIYFQFGDAGPSLDAGGLGTQIGAEYRFTEHGIFLSANFTYVSGDDDALDSDLDSFVSYENVNDLLILEDPWFGIDLDHNYLSVKIGGGVSFLENKLELSILAGFNKLLEDVAAEDDIGHELDVRARLLASKQLSFRTAIAFLFGSDVIEKLGTEDEDRMFLWTLGADLQF